MASNYGHHNNLTAKWRSLTDEQISSFPKSRKQAIEAGSEWYVTKSGKGHDCLRNLENRGCLRCLDDKRLAKIQTAKPRKQKVVSDRVINVFNMNMSVIGARA